MNTVLLLDHSFKLSCRIADTLFRSDINVFRVASEEHCTQEANRLAPIGIIVAISDGSDKIQALLQTLLRNREVPVIVISENHDEAEELAALQLGVSAFLDGDASCELIAARILHGLNIGVVERNRRNAMEPRRVLSHDRLELDLDAHNAKWRGQELEVTCKEMSLLVALIQRPGVVKSRSSLIDHAYSENIHVDERTIDSHMKRIR
jgi:two-component system response regulator ChvI